MSYPSDLTDAQWNGIKHHFDRKNYGNRRIHPIRTLVNAVFYLTKTGCQWRMLPKNFPPYSTVYSFYRRAVRDGTWERMMDDLVKKSRQKSQRAPEPTYCILDSQSVKTAGPAENRGIDGGKKNQRTQTAYRSGYSRAFVARTGPCCQCT